MLLLWLGVSLFGLAGYIVLGGLWIRYIFAHVGGLGIIGLLACWAGAIAKKKGYSYRKAFFAGFVPPVVLGGVSACLVYALGGHGCGGIVSLFAAFVVVLFYLLAKKRGENPKTGTAI